MFEVAALGNAIAVDLEEFGFEVGWFALGSIAGQRKLAFEIPIRRSLEGHTFAFTLDHDASRDRLHSTSRKSGHDFLPQHRRDLVAIEAVEHAASFLGVDHLAVELARIVQRCMDRLFGDLGEDHAVHFDIAGGRQHLEQVPGNGFALAILICC